ncbi:MAG: cob(I)yrinic acid a,c-diamide adenosyltransferase [Acetobacteraceae bacterium]|nr:cob(I)yrinic acid a,c-diamide adenosyltransferase [Acetobacteraceae bacterium]
MVRIDRVTTRGGDAGETSLGDGTRIRKDMPRVTAIGEVDEANAAIGVLRLRTADQPAIDATLGRIQNELFDLGADLCVPGTGGDWLRLTDAPLAQLEADAASLNATLPPLRSFVLPGGTAGAAHAHMARTITRRAERALVQLHHTEPLNPNLIRYLNRLSDYLFILARCLNAPTLADVTWRPGGG